MQCWQKYPKRGCVAIAKMVFFLPFSLCNEVALPGRNALGKQLLEEAGFVFETAMNKLTL